MRKRVPGPLRTLTWEEEELEGRYRVGPEDSDLVTV